MIPDNVEEHTGGTTVLFKIISRYSWDRLRGFHKACPGSRIEHVMKGTGIYVLHLPPGCAKFKKASV